MARPSNGLERAGLPQRVTWPVARDFIGTNRKGGRGPPGLDLEELAREAAKLLSQRTFLLAFIFQRVRWWNR